MKATLRRTWDLLDYSHPQDLGGKYPVRKVEPGVYEVERIPNPASFAGDWLVIKGTTIGQSEGAWRQWGADEVGGNGTHWGDAQISFEDDDRPFVPVASRRMPYTLNYSLSGRDRVRVAINPDHYGKDIKIILQLEAILKKEIPFRRKVTAMPRVEVMGGNHRRGIIMVEMVVQPIGLTQYQAVVKLRQAGFAPGNEIILG